MRTPHKQSNRDVTRGRVQTSRAYQTLWLITICALAIAVFALMPGAPVARASAGPGVSPARAPISPSALSAPFPPAPPVVAAPPAHPYPPTPSNGAAHWQPVAWPSDGAWYTYTMGGASINDPRTQDPSNGGTSPQNYVNVSSCLPDKTAPSVYWAFDNVNDIIFYRFKVEQIANTYATGPSAGSYGTTDPWNSAQWTVLIDLNGDGYRDFAVQLDGSSGAPSTAIDRLTSYWGTSKSQSVDPSSDPALWQLFHNPTAFIDLATNRILNYHSSLSPDTSWPNGANETLWDYGTTRAMKNSGVGCEEYILDYQIPMGMLDASAYGGPTVNENTRLAFIFATANSLNNPLQKDAVLQGDTYFVGDPSRPVPFGDGVTLGGGPSPQQPSVDSITASGCNLTTLTAQVSDSMTVTNGVVLPTVASVAFYYYYDDNGNAQPDDGQTWTLAANGTTTNNPIGRWTASWNSTGLPQGQYLIGVKATDLDGNITWSYLTAGQLPGGTPPNYTNPSPSGLLWATFANTCGVPPPSIYKSVSSSQVTAGQQVTFTLSISNTSGGALSVSAITDTLPAGFSYVSTVGGTLSPTTSPSGGATGDIVWTFSPAATIVAGNTGTLIFLANSSTTVGTYSNVASTNTSEGVLISSPVQISVGAPRLTIAKTANVSSANPGDTITYTIWYANDSPVNVTGVVISDTLPTGITFVSAQNGGTYNAGNRTITWSIGSLASGEGPFTVSFSASVDSPYPDAAASPLVNTATIASNQTSPASASASTYINAPRANMLIQKDATATQIAPGGYVTYTISYSNTGTASASSVVISDTLPVSFTLTSATTPTFPQRR